MSEDNKQFFLTLCDKSLSGSLCRLFNFQCTNVDPTDFSGFESLLYKLKDFKDKQGLKGIIFADTLSFGKEKSSYDMCGIELFKHIRLTESLGNLRCLPIILLNCELTMQHLRAQKDNVLLVSPGCYTIQVPFSINKLMEIIKGLKSFESLEKMKEEINPFVTWSKEDDVISQHDNFNRYGPYKLMSEHFDELPKYLLQHYNALIGTLWFKKLQFLELQVFCDLPAKTHDEELYKKTVADKRILYVDDEHRLGWSFALYSIIANNIEEDVYKLFQGKDSLITSPDGSFTCIDSYNEASKLFDFYKNKLNSGLRKFARTESTDDLHAFEYDLVILDLRLEKKADRGVPADKISGIKLLNKIKGIDSIKGIDPSIPIIVFTASEKALNYREAIDHGATEYWIKVRNSVSELKDKLIKCLQNSEQIRKLWLDIRKVEEKKYLFCYYYADGRLKTRTMEPFKKPAIARLLRESFLLLQRDFSAYEKSVCDYNNDKKIAANMGLIWEARLSQIIKSEKKGEKYDDLRKANLIPDVELEIKDIRNRAVHSRGTPVGHEDSLYIFEKTLDLCLSDETLRCKS